MTSKEAFKKVTEFLGEEPEIVGIREYVDKFGFIVIPADGEGDSFGGDIIFVSKDDGEVALRGDIKHNPREPWLPVELDDEDHQKAIDILLGEVSDGGDEDNA